jgi:hypothetical protein
MLLARSILLGFVLVAAPVTATLVAAPRDAAAAGSCTRGTNCYCDCVKQNPPSSACTSRYPGVTYDAAVRRCEDWEDPQWHDNTGSRPWWKSPSGYNAFRGGDNLWQATYGAGSGACSWTNGLPASPKLGYTCTAGTCALSEWSAGDPWDGNQKACIDIQRSGEVDDEIAGLTISGVFDGSTYMGARVRPGSTSEIAGSMATGLNSEMGITMAIAYSTNLASAVTSQCWNGEFVIQPGAWKHEQWGTGNQFPMGNTGPSNYALPFGGGSPGVKSQSACLAARNASNISVGVLECDSAPALRFGASTAVFKRSRDWPLGTWGCVRAYLGGVGTTSGSMWIAFQGPNDTSERVIFQVSNFDFKNSFNEQKIDRYDWDAYYNGNGGQAQCNSTQTFYRYYDNVHVRAGQPVSCAQIGFGGTAAPPPLGAPGQPVLVP